MSKLNGVGLGFGRGRVGRAGRWAAVWAAWAGALAGSAAAQDGGEELSNDELIQGFNHFVFIDNVELAESYARALLDRDLSGEEFLGLIEESARVERRFEAAYRRAMASERLEDEAAALFGLYESGRRARARDPREIERNIGLLTGPLRGQQIARGLLVEAREYAVPQLLDAVLFADNLEMRAEASGVLIALGRNAVRPLTAALLGVEPEGQERIIRILGSIPEPSSLPYLYEVRERTRSEVVRESSENAIRRLGGEIPPRGGVSGAYRELADRYFGDRVVQSLNTFPGERNQVLWEYIPGVGLFPTAILTDLFHEAKTMELAERALELDRADTGALSLWLAANFSREIDEPSGYANPAYGRDRGALFFATRAGSEPVQRVLARALRERDTRLALRAIEALSRSAGREGLFGTSGDEMALVDALTYSDRRVRYEAAQVLGKANPRDGFRGAERVVPTLAGLVRDAGERYAVVIASDVDRQQSIRATLEGRGYEVLSPASDFDGVREGVSRVAGVDLMVLDVPAGQTSETIRRVRGSARLSATPVLAVLPALEASRMRGDYRDDRLTMLVRRGLSGEQLAESAEDVAVGGSGEPLSEREAERYAIEALEVLRTLAVSDTAVFRIEDAAGPLAASLGSAESEAIRLGVADVLSRVDLSRAQVAVMDAALGAPSESERVQLLTDVTRSAKRFGNMLEDRQVRRLVELTETGTESEAVAAASLMGALNLPTNRVVPMIVGG